MNTQPTKLSFKRLYFKKSKNRKGDDCFISKIKQYATSEDGHTKEFIGDKIIIANISGNFPSGITHAGRWDVNCMEMKNGSGFIVLNSSLSIDEIKYRENGWKLEFLVNGRAEKLKTKDNKIIPLYFDCERFYPIEKIAENLERKFFFLQLPDDFDRGGFIQDFITSAHSLYERYLKETGQEITDDDLNRLKNKFK